MSGSNFSTRSAKAERFVAAIENNVFTKKRYFRIPTGIEHRFGNKAAAVHEILYRSMGPTTDLLRYFPDSLYLDRWRHFPTWQPQQKSPVLRKEIASTEDTGLLSLFVEYKFSDSERKRPISTVPTSFIGIIEREAWLTYKRLTSRNPSIGTYLDGKRTRVALFYAATYAPDVLYAGWEEWISPIEDAVAVRKDIARPNSKSVQYSTGSGTPWINFDIRCLKPMERFLSENLYWEDDDAAQVTAACKKGLQF